MNFLGSSLFFFFSSILCVNRYRKFSVEDMDPYSAYDKNDGKMRFFARTLPTRRHTHARTRAHITRRSCIDRFAQAATSVKDPAVNRSLQLRNVIREFVEKANNETGKTPCTSAP